MNFTVRWSACNSRQHYLFNSKGICRSKGRTNIVQAANIVEQNANRALEIAHRAYVLETGEMVLEGTGKELLVNPKVKEAYLGG